jgi:hypothetical protein
MGSKPHTPFHSLGLSSRCMAGKHSPSANKNRRDTWELCRRAQQLSEEARLLREQLAATKQMFRQCSTAGEATPRAARPVFADFLLQMDALQSAEFRTLLSSSASPSELSSRRGNAKRKEEMGERTSLAINRERPKEVDG